MISVPLFVAGYIILHANFSVLWRYFAWCNQTLAVFTLWALTVYLTQKRKPYVITLIPALFMTAVCSTYIPIAMGGTALPQELALPLGGAVTLFIFVLFLCGATNTCGGIRDDLTGTGFINQKRDFHAENPLSFDPRRGRTAGETVRKLNFRKPGHAARIRSKICGGGSIVPSSPAQSTTRTGRRAPPDRRYTRAPVAATSATPVNILFPCR